MLIIQSYPVAVALCVVTMLCWGSWANTQKLASKEWRFQLFYWDYSIGVLLLALLLAFTVGSHGQGGRAFLADLAQADAKWLAHAGAPSLQRRPGETWRRFWLRVAIRCRAPRGSRVTG